MKKILCLILVTTMLCSACSIVVANDSSITKKFMEPVNLGEPIETCQPLDVQFDVINGKDYMYTTSSGTPAQFSVYNLDDNVLVANFGLTGTKSCWIHVINSKGIVYMASDGVLFSYDPYKNEFKNIGRAADGESASFVMTIDEEDNLYIGTYPGGKIIKYIEKSGTFEDLGQVDPSASYVRSIAYHKGYIYAGTFGDNVCKFFKIDAKNPSKKKEFPLPVNNAYYDVNKLSWLYTMNMADDLVVIYAKEVTVSPMLVFDTTTDSFIDIEFTGSFKGLYSSVVKDNKSYFFSKGKMYALNTKTKKVEDLDFTVDSADAFRGSGWVTVNHPDLPGESLATVDPNAGWPILYNLQTKKRVVLDDINLPGGKIAIQALENGPKGDVYVGGYMGHAGARYTPSTGEFLNFPIGQTEGMIEYNGKQYFGIYTRAWLYEYDPNLEVGPSNPKSIAMVGEEQDRPFAMDAAEDKIFMGTIPDYSKYGGALGIYDLKTQKMTTTRNIVENQSIMSIAYKDGKIYGSTTAYGGLGAKPIVDEAKMFIFDVATNKKVEEFIPKIKGVTKPLHIGGIAFDKDGLLWGVSGYTLFAYDLKKKSVTKTLSFGDYEFNPDKHVWRPTYIRFDKDGLLYTNIKGLKVIDTKTMEYIDLSAKTGLTQLFTIGSDDNIYYSSGSQFKMIPVADVEVTGNDIANIKTMFSDKIGLVVGNPIGYANGNVVSIDKNNANVAPIVENGRTLVPVRFIGESLGAEVSWDDATQTAKLTKEGLEISITLNKSEILVNGNAITLDVPAMTKEGRTLLPLRAVANAFQKEVFWDDRGIIILSNESVKLETSDIKKIDLFFKIYIKNLKSEQDSISSLKEEYQKEVDKIGGKKIEIVNSGFEEAYNNQKPPVGFSKLNAFENGCSAEVTTERASEGTQSLKIVDVTTTGETGFITDPIKIDPKKNYELLNSLFIATGRTSVSVFMYDKDGREVGKLHNNLTLPTGMWNVVKTSIPITNPITDNIRIKVYTSEFWMSESYYDEFSLFEVEK